jgi:cellulose synthase/poly-beta-1,6-N-acetylglucosamine synthase-like glycosyltransferase
MLLLSQVLLIVALVLLVPVGVFTLQVLLAVLGRVPAAQSALASARRPQLAVLVPAHDEASGIAAALRTMRAQLAPGDRLLVVADNCSDATAQIAAAAGAEVVERFNGELRGKGYALDFGVRHLQLAPPEVVVIVDADCELGPGALDTLARECARSARPVQALYLMHAPPAAGLKTRIAAFAWVVKNQARPLGFRRLGLPCQLMGTGMAFPWPLLRDAPLASGHIVEDMQLGLDLASAGSAPLFCPQALVTSVFPSDARGIADQRSRWEQGHVGVIAKEGPRALWRAITQRRADLAAMVLDLCVPPLTMLVMLLVVQAIVDAVVVALGGAPAALWLALLALAMVSLAVAVAWARFARHIVSLGELLGAPLYVLGKLPLYARFFKRGKREWVRTKRDERRGE